VIILAVFYKIRSSIISSGQGHTGILRDALEALLPCTQQLWLFVGTEVSTCESKFLFSKKEIFRALYRRKETSPYAVLLDFDTCRPTVNQRFRKMYSL
jgi:hypothetical protein